MVSNRQATEAVIAHVRSRPRALGGAVFGTALAIPFAASAAWAAPICACGGAPSARAAEPPTSDVRGMSADAAERSMSPAAEPAPAPPSHSPAPAPPPTSLPEPPPAEPPPPPEPAPEPPPTTTTTAPPEAPPMAPSPEPSPAPEPPRPDVSGMSADAAERWIEAVAEPAPPELVRAPAEEQGPPSATPPTTTTAPPEPPSPDVTGMTPDAAKRWLESETEPDAEGTPLPVSPTTPDVTGMTPDAAEQWLDADEEPDAEGTPLPVSAPTPDVTGMTPDAAERWLQAEAEPPEPPEPQIYGVDRHLYNRLPSEDQAAIRDDWEREQRFDPPPGCMPVQGPYLNEEDSALRLSRREPDPDRPDRHPAGGGPALCPASGPVPE